MLNRLKIALVATALSVLPSCDDLRDSYEDCGIWLEFVFDHNMEFTDSFSQQVGSVNVLLFDANEELVLARNATADELEGRKRMFLGDDLPMGDYTAVTVGGMSEHFSFSRLDDGEFNYGESGLSDIKLALRHENGVMDSNIPHVWYGKPVAFSNRADLSVTRVPLVRQTNNFNVTLQHTVKDPETRAEGDPLYTAEIIAPEAGAYDIQNEPLVREKLTYRPHTQNATTIPSTAGGTTYRNTGHINTMRLLPDEEEKYRLVIRNTDTEEEVWDHDLLDLLPYSQNSLRPDGTTMSFDEYLDREVNWNIIIDHETTATEGFVAISITINGWIVWQNSIGI